MPKPNPFKEKIKKLVKSKIPKEGSAAEEKKEGEKPHAESGAEKAKEAKSDKFSKFNFMAKNPKAAAFAKKVKDKADGKGGCKK